ncbi:hypothetical protein D1151_00920 [Emergencia sp. 1XD21-10]|nr:hypothetical protein [Emergencia sp. 1XD21-10]
MLQRRCKGGRAYTKAKYHLAIDDYEYSIIIDNLNNLRSKLIIKFAHAPIKKFRIKITEV